MPVKVYGTGGGKNTKDATALPDDVRAGKTFYNAEGKQTGIWTPQATDYTGDATATDNDILTGKSAYTKDGKVDGTLDVTDLTGDATATAADILSGKTAYNGSGKVTGTLVEKTYSDFVSDSDTQPSDVANGKVFYNDDGRQVGNANIVKCMEITTGSDKIGTTSYIQLYIGSIIREPTYGYKSNYYASLELVGTLIAFEINGNIIKMPWGNIDSLVGLCGYTTEATQGNVLIAIDNNKLFFVIADCTYKIYYID